MSTPPGYIQLYAKYLNGTKTMEWPEKHAAREICVGIGITKELEEANQGSDTGATAASDIIRCFLQGNRNVRRNSVGTPERIQPSDDSDN